MRAVGAMTYGGPEVLEVLDLPDLEPGPGEVLVRVHAAAVNPTDTYQYNGSRRKAQADQDPPYVPGMDAAGVLAGIGDGVTTDLQVGDRVMAIVVPQGPHGAYAQQVALPAGSVAAAPAGSSHAQACTLPMNGLTARLALDRLDLDAVRDGGGFATVRGLRTDTPRGLDLHQIWVWEYSQEQAELDRLRQQTEDGVLTPRVADTYPPQAAADAHRRLAAGGVRGRLVLEL